jgi:hypothetical protein
LGEEQGCPGERLRRCRGQAPRGRTTARFLGDLWDAEGANGHGCARRRAQRGTLGGYYGRPGRPLSMTVGSAPCSPCEGSSLGDPSQPEGRLEEMAPGPLGAPAPPFFQGPPCRTSVLSVPPWRKDGASSPGQTPPGMEPPVRLAAGSAAPKGPADSVTMRATPKQYGIPGGKNANGPNNAVAQASAGLVLVVTAILTAGGLEKKIQDAVTAGQRLQEGVQGLPTLARVHRRILRQCQVSLGDGHDRRRA